MELIFKIKVCCPSLSQNYYEHIFVKIMSSNFNPNINIYESTKTCSRFSLVFTEYLVAIAMELQTKMIVGKIFYDFNTKLTGHSC